jgi:glycosyltransferase involved in cell wall biosynthesis
MTGKRLTAVAANRPLVSVVTPSYNQSRFLGETILSVLNQGYPHIEYLVIDGASTDGSVDIIRQYEGQIAYWVSEPDRGQSHAINKGLRRTRGEIVTWLNSDDVLLPGAVSRVVRFLAEHPDVDVCNGRADRIDEYGRPIPTPTLPKDLLDFGATTALAGNLVNSPGAFWRRGIMERVGLLDEELHYVMDYEWWLRMVLAGGTFRRMPHPSVAAFRVHRGSKSAAQQERFAQETFAVLDRLFSDPCLESKLGLSRARLLWQKRRLKARTCLHAFYGCYHQGGRPAEAARWLLRAGVLFPPIYFAGEWWRLALARLRRAVRDGRHLSRGQGGPGQHRPAE